MVHIWRSILSSFGAKPLRSIHLKRAEIILKAAITVRKLLRSGRQHTISTSLSKACKVRNAAASGSYYARKAAAAFLQIHFKQVPKQSPSFCQIRSGVARRLVLPKNTGGQKRSICTAHVCLLLRHSYKAPRSPSRQRARP